MIPFKRTIFKGIKIVFFVIEKPRRVVLFFRHKVLNIYNSGIYYTIELENVYIKIQNKKRQKTISKSWKLFPLMEYNSLEEIRDRFVGLNKNKKAHIIQKDCSVLVIEKIDALPLSAYINHDNFMFLVDKSILKLSQIHKKEALSHGDFHLDNILVNEQLEIFFIDFDFKYRLTVKEHELECDVLKFLHYLKIYYPKVYKTYKVALKDMIFSYIEKDRLQSANDLMKDYLQGSLDELFD